MRKVIVNNIVSLDGYYADSGGDPLALEMDGAFDRANLESLEHAGSVLLGRESFDGFSAYWPSIADAPQPEDPLAPQAREYDDVNRAISRRFGSVPKVVVSDRGPVPQDNPWRDSTTVIGRGEAEAWVRTARGQHGHDIVVFGSRVLWNHLFQRGLVDELHLMLSPVTLGAGVPLFGSPARLQLHEARTFDGSSNVQLRYGISSR